jgi:hypothetical protein
LYRRGAAGNARAAQPLIVVEDGRGERRQRAPIRLRAVKRMLLFIPRASKLSVIPAKAGTRVTSPLAADPPKTQRPQSGHLTWIPASAGMTVSN